MPHWQAPAVPGALHRPGHAASPPGAVASQTSPPSGSSTPSPQLDSVAVNALSAGFFALIVPCSGSHMGDGSFTLRRTFEKLPQCGQRAVTLVNFLLATGFAWVAAHSVRLSCAPEESVMTSSEEDPVLKSSGEEPDATMNRPGGQV